MSPRISRPPGPAIIMLDSGPGGTVPLNLTGHGMESGKAEKRKGEFTALFERFGLEVDWKFLSENFSEVPEYEWSGFLQSIHSILARRAAAERKPRKE